MSTCVVEGCERVTLVKRVRLCSPHYQQQRAGKPFTPAKHRVANRDADGNKRCSRCTNWKPEAAFASSSGKGDHLQSRCRECNSDIYRGQAELIRDKMRLARFGLTRQAFDALLASQGGGCAICGTTAPGGSHWHTDHDHACCPRSDKTCGKCVRGILCNACNTGLGFLRDDVETLATAIDYLNGHSRAAISAGAA